MAFLKLGAGLKFGQLPFTLLERSTLSTPARLLWGILYGFGEQSFPSVPYLALLMGFKPKSKNAVRRYLSELEGGGFLISTPGPAGQANQLTLILPDFAQVQDLEIAEIALRASRSPEKPLGKSRARRRGKRALMGSQDRFKYLRQREAPKPTKPPQKADTPPVTGETPPGHRGDPPPVTSETPPGHRGDPEKSSRFETREGADDLPPLALFDTPQAPAGWADWADIYQAQTGKPWVWTARDIAGAFALNALLSPVFMPHVKVNFARNDYHAARGCQLNKLLDNLNEFLPTKQQMEPAAPAPAAGKGSQLPAIPEPTLEQTAQGLAYHEALQLGLSPAEAFRHSMKAIS